MPSEHPFEMCFKENLLTERLFSSYPPRWLKPSNPDFSQSPLPFYCTSSFLTLTDFCLEGPHSPFYLLFHFLLWCHVCVYPLVFEMSGDMVWICWLRGGCCYLLDICLVSVPFYWVVSSTITLKQVHSFMREPRHWSESCPSLVPPSMSVSDPPDALPGPWLPLILGFLSNLIRFSFWLIIC